MATRAHLLLNAQKRQPNQSLSHLAIATSGDADSLSPGPITASFASFAKMNIQNYPGDHKFKETLFRYDSKVSLDELKSLMMGSILAVEMVQPSRVLEILHGDNEENRPELESLDQATEYMGGLMSLWNKLASHQSFNNPFRFSKIPDLKPDDRDRWLEFCRLRESEFTLFLRGLYAGNTPSAGELAEPTKELLESYLPFRLDMGRKALLKHREEIEQNRSYLPPGMLGALAENIDENYLSLYDDFLEQSLLWRKEHMAEIQNSETVFRTEPKVGRNDPCTCGSGKKFKKCCAH